MWSYQSHRLWCLTTFGSFTPEWWKHFSRKTPPTQLVKASLSSLQSLSHVRLFATPWIAARQASLSITNSQSSLRLKSIESVMPSSRLILCRPLLLLPPIPLSISLLQWVNSSHEVAKVLEFHQADEQTGITQLSRPWSGDWECTVHVADHTLLT